MKEDSHPVTEVDREVEEANKPSSRSDPVDDVSARYGFHDVNDYQQSAVPVIVGTIIPKATEPRPLKQTKIKKVVLKSMY